MIRFLAIALFATMVSQNAYARIVDRTQIKDTRDGYEIVIHFATPLRHLSHTPKDGGDSLRVQLRSTRNLAVENPELHRELAMREALTWDRSSGAPIVEIIYEGGSPNQPRISFQFSAKVEFDVRSSRDLRSLIVTVRKELLVPEIKTKATGDQKIESLYNAQDVDPKYRELFDRALDAIENKNHSLAIQIFTKIAEQSDGATKKKAIELLGVAREKNGQLAHAKAEYERFLELYPDAPEAERVRQRLFGILTAHAKAKPSKDSRKRRKDSEWDWDGYGSLSQFYFRDQTTPEGQETQVNRSTINTGIDLMATGRSDFLRIDFRAVGGYDKDLLEDADQGYVSNLSIETEFSKPNLRLTFGRQTLSSDGVLGRFDGLRGEWELWKLMRLNIQFGHPVVSSRQDFDADRRFFGANMDFGPYASGWDLNAYFIEQRNKGATDRRSVGGEVRFSDADRSIFNTLELDSSIFAMVDYDIYYSNLNAAMLLANWDLSTRTTINLHMDYRNNPFLTTTNAIIGQIVGGQGVEDLYQLYPIYTLDEIEQLAQDRTAKSQSMILGVTQVLNEHWQVSGELSRFRVDGMVASGGVEASPPSGPDYYYSAQVMGSDLFIPNDISIVGFRYGSTDRYDNYTFYSNVRLPLQNKMRLNPKFTVSYRTGPADNERMILRPLLRFDYLARKWLRLEFEGGFEYSKETVAGIDMSTTGAFVFAGYRSEF